MGLVRSVLAALAVMILALLPAAASPPAVNADDQAAIQTVIRAQLDAFKRDDGAAAYALAAPGLKVLYPNVETFMNMVKSRYQPVYRPGSVVFGTMVPTSQGPVQRVFVTGPDGMAYIANYSMQRQSDGSWKISGCTVTRDRGSSAI